MLRLLRNTALTGLLATVLLVSSTSAQTTVIHAGLLIDGRSDAVREQVTVVVEENRIADVRDGFVDVEGALDVIDLTDATVLPGLIDLHVHLEGETSKKRYIERFTLNEADVALNSTVFAHRTLMAGFTTVRDVGGRGVNIALRDAVDAGKVVGPRIFTSGKSLATTGGHADPTNGWRRELMGDPGPKEGVLNGPDGARQAVRQRYKNGADLIKITATGGVLSLAKSGTAPQFTDEELEAVIETATDMGFHVAAHAHGVEGMQRAIRAGVKTIEHGTLMDEETMELMKQYGTYHVPTITAGMSVADSARVPGYYPDVVVPKAIELGPRIKETFAKSYAAGVNIAFGTDAGVFAHGRNAIEFEYMVDAGMPPIDAIRSATTVNAEVLGMADDLGSIESGKLADIVAVEDNPLEQIETLQHVIFVMKDGVVYKGASEPR